MYGGRNRGGYDIEGGRGGRDANNQILEQQNNERINELSQHVARLKGLTMDIGQEVQEQNSLLDSMGTAFRIPEICCKTVSCESEPCSKREVPNTCATWWDSPSLSWCFCGGS